MAHNLVGTLKPADEKTRRRIADALKRCHEETSFFSFVDVQHRSMIQSFGVAYHHSGLPPQVRVAIELLLKEGHLRFCVATMGLSLGINFAVRSALMTDYKRPGSHGMQTYDDSEVLQMLGRAGRRGRDLVGISLWASLEAYKKFGKAKRQQIQSRLRQDPTTILGLISRHTSLTRIEKFYNKSFKRHDEQNVDHSLVTVNRLRRKLETDSIPCLSPIHEIQQVSASKDATCDGCKHRSPCHAYIEARNDSPLDQMHRHLHAIDAIDHQEKLTVFGEVARYFPQSGGLLLAQLIVNQGDEVDVEKLAELMGALALARHKHVNVPERYRFPFQGKKIEKQLLHLYPRDLFPEVYDAPFGRRTFYQLKEFNKGAGYLVKTWLGAKLSWAEFIECVASQSLAQGDIVALLYRVGTYLQSFNQLKQHKEARNALRLRDHLLRAPLSLG